MTDAVELWERPRAAEITMLVGWRQWADAGSISSGLPGYLIKQADARQIGKIRSEGFYLFQVPGSKPRKQHQKKGQRTLSTKNFI